MRFQRLPAGTDRSIASASGSSQQLAEANTERLSLDIQNISDTNWGINEFGGTAAIGTAGTYTLAPGAVISISTNRQVNVIGTAGKALTATEVG